MEPTCLGKFSKDSFNKRKATAAALYLDYCIPYLGILIIYLIFQKETESYDSLSSHQVFTLSHPGSATIMFCAENENSAERWISCLRDAVSF